MAENTAIEWCDSTFNPWIGCTKISPACDHCYAEALMDTRHQRVQWGGERSRTSAGNWQLPRRWQKQAAEFKAEHQRRRRVFCSSLADVFDNQVPTEWRDDLWALIRDTPDLDWLLLTKRPQNIGKMLPAFWDEVKGHVWLGTTVEDQQRAGQNVPHLLLHGSAVRFVSCEPLLGPINLTHVSWPRGDAFPWINALTRGAFGSSVWGGGTPLLFNPPHRLDWVIAGGESGPGARPSHPEWFRSLRDECEAAGVPFLFKQWGEWVGAHHGDHEYGTTSAASGERQFWPVSETNRHHHWGDVTSVHAISFKVGKRVAGRSLDGVEHNGFPELM